MPRSRALIIMTRLPLGESVKTRLATVLSPAQRCELQRCFLMDMVESLQPTLDELSCDLFVYYANDEAANNKIGVSNAHGSDMANEASDTHADADDENAEGASANDVDASEAPGQLAGIFNRNALFVPQAGGHLGTRMRCALIEVFARGYSEVALIGSDIPEIRGDDLARAFSALADADCSIMPSDDGGYCLIAMRRPLEEPFTLQRYGHASVLEDTLHTIERAGMTAVLLPPGHDVDTPLDLMALHERLRTRDRCACSHTLAFFERLCGQRNRFEHSYSIVVPLYNECAALESLIAALSKLSCSAEIIMVDGQSEDGTYETLVAMLGEDCVVGPSRVPADMDELVHPNVHSKRPFKPGFYLFQGERGRACQQNAGAILSRGDVILFFHADSHLPDDPLHEMDRVLRKRPYGCFGVKFPLTNPLMVTNRFFSNLRVRRGIVFGDQGIFMRRDLFFAVGMFPEISLMEDYQLSMTLRSHGFMPGLARHRILTSNRRYPKDVKGTWEVMKLMFSLRHDYNRGADPDELLRRYGDGRETDERKDAGR